MSEFEEKHLGCFFCSCGFWGATILRDIRKKEHDQLAIMISNGYFLIWGQKIDLTLPQQINSLVYTNKNVWFPFHWHNGKKG